MHAAQENYAGPAVASCCPNNGLLSLAAPTLARRGRDYHFALLSVIRGELHALVSFA